MELALYQPDIPQNTGTLMRLAACMDIKVHIIEPCGFVLSDKNLKRAGMDYMSQVKLVKHSSWEAFKENTAGKRHVLMTTKTDLPYTEFKFEENDILIAGRESAGVPESVHNECKERVTIPMTAETRSLNIAIASAMILGESLKQTNSFPTS